MRSSRTKAWLGNVALVAAALVLALAAAELVLRVYFHGSIGTPDYSQSIYTPSATLGWTLKPGTVTRQQELDFSVTVAINSKGLRGPEIAYERTPGVFRILLVSDSAMFGSGVEYEQSVPAVLGRLLEPTRTEIVNLSVPAYSTVQEYLLFMAEGRRYRPDLVLLGLSPGNDLQTNHEPLQRLFQKSQRRPFARLGPSNELILDYDHAKAAAARADAEGAPGWFERFLDNLVIVRLVDAAAHKLVGDNRLDPNVFLGPVYLREFAPEYAAASMTRERYETLWREAWAVAETLITAIRDETLGMGARFGLFVATSKLQGEPAMRERVLAAFPGVALDVERIDRDMASLAERIGATFIPITPDVTAAAANAATPLYHDFEDEHWTPAGAAIAAQALAKGLRAHALVPAN